MRILLPKARAEQARWQASLEGYSVTAQWVDPWLISELPESGVMRAVWLNLDQYKGVICVSPIAARVLINALDQYWPMPPVQVNWLCNGPRTATLLEQAGLHASHPDAGYTAEDILALPQTHVTAGDKWLIVKGEGGRTTLAETLSKRGAGVTEQIVYERRLNADAIREMSLKAQHCEAIWLSSTFLAEQLVDTDAAFWQQWPGEWWVSSERLANWCREHQLSTIVQAPGATPEALVSLLNHHR
ncbi:MAG: uroporphyrinogen-III synthase [Reinekea sp.]|jgi:uroporphyrinogen-III synthase